MSPTSGILAVFLTNGGFLMRICLGEPFGRFGDKSLLFDE